MTELKITHALRYVFSGVIAFIYFYIYDPELARDFSIATGNVGFPLILSVVGSAFYFVYRPLVYETIIERLQYIFPKKKLNYRKYLMQEYKINFKDAGQLFIEIRDTHLKDRYESLSILASGIHMCYQASLLTIPFIIALNIDYDLDKLVVLLTVFIVTFSAAFISDLAYEEAECNMLRSLNIESRNQIARNLGLLK